MQGRCRASARERKPGIPFRTRRQRSFGSVARTISRAWSVTFKNTVAIFSEPSE
jgi:hypothetical protein